MTKMFKIAVDVGYGFVKGANERGEKVLFRSLAVPAQDRKLSELFGQVENESDVEVVITKPNGEQQRVAIGDLALDSKNASYAFDRNKVNHSTTKILLATAASMLMKDVTSPIHLITGLPLDHFYEQKEEFERSLLNLQVDVEHFVGKYKGHKTKVAFDKVTVFVQGGSSIYSSLYDETGKLVQTDLLGNGDLIAVVNIGFRTIDVVVFEAGRQFKMMPELSFTIDTGAGMSELRVAAQKAFYEKTGLRLNLPEIEPILARGGHQKFRGQTINISHEIAEAQDNIAKIIQDHLVSQWGNRHDLISKVFMCGGGAVDLQSKLIHFHPNVEIVANSQFADVKGYLIVGEMLEAIEQRAKVEEK